MRCYSVVDHVTSLKVAARQTHVLDAAALGNERNVVSAKHSCGRCRRTCQDTQSPCAACRRPLPRSGTLPAAWLQHLRTHAPIPSIRCSLNPSMPESRNGATLPDAPHLPRQLTARVCARRPLWCPPSVQALGRCETTFSRPLSLIEGRIYILTMQV